MAQSTELGSISATLERTPNIAPFYDEVKRSFQHIKEGDISDNPLFEIIHGYVAAQAKADKLTEVWKVVSVNGGLIVAHQDFLDIQNQFYELEKSNGNNSQWNETLCLEAFEKYIGTVVNFRQRHISYFNQALTSLDENTRKKVLDIAQKQFPHLLQSATEDMVIVAIPSQFDNPQLWSDFGFSNGLLKRIPSWAKIHESGVVLGSRLHRDDKLRGHDYFSYAARAVRTGEIPLMDDKLVLTGQHEGSHSITDALLIHLLKIGSDNPIYEGIPGALGKDERESKHTKISFEQLLIDPCPETSARSETVYVAGAKYWASLVKIMQSRGVNEEEIWARVLGNSLRTAIDLSEGKNFDNLRQGEKVSKFLSQLPTTLEIELSEMEKMYNSLNVQN